MSDEPRPPTTRRAFIAGAAVLGVAAVGAPALLRMSRKAPRRIEGGFADDHAGVGHRLRDGGPWPAVREERRVKVAIVGGGVAGLSAAWWLQSHGMHDFAVLELAPRAGGNARWGELDGVRHPWAAHYVPVPGPGATLVRRLFAELGVLRPDGTWEERHLCHAPQERLWLHGQWRPGLEPDDALDARGRDEFARFAALADEWRATGAFTVPSARGLVAGAGGPAARALDASSFAAWLDTHDLRSPALRWYLDYACRDDYGASLATTSAWAGLHYFAAREQSDDPPLTWAEGNGWIVERLLARLGDRVVPDAPAYAVEPDGAGVRVLTPGVAWRADQVIWAAPHFVARGIVPGAERLPRVETSPWLTANLVLDRPPAERGAEPAWDNVIYGSPSLGYVRANHQSLAVHHEREVWTYYLPLADRAPADARRLLRETGWERWVESIVADLARAHPDLRDCVRRVDVLRMGHAMPRPGPGFLAARERAAAVALLGGRVLLAHSDAAGLGLFEEAQERGVRAAALALGRVGGTAAAGAGPLV